MVMLRLGDNRIVVAGDGQGLRLHKARNRGGEKVRGAAQT